MRRKCLDKGKSLLAVLIKGKEKLENIALYVKVTWVVLGFFFKKQLAKVVGKQDKKQKTIVEDIIYFIFLDSTSGSLN